MMRPSLLCHGRLAANRAYTRSLSAQAQSPSIKITTLPNHMRVATESTPSHFSSVGLYVDAGARYETPETSGVSHFLDRLAFKSTATRSDADMSLAIHSLGGQIMCSASRESMMYQSTHFHKATPLAISLIADTVLNPSFLPEDIDAQRDAAAYELRELSAKPDMILPEILHAVAYGSKGLGNPLLCPEDQIQAIDEVALRRNMREMYRPERIVVAGVGMPHEELVELAEKLFSSLKQAVPVAQLSASRANSVPHVPPHLLSASAPSVIKSLTRAASYLLPNALSPSLNPFPSNESPFLSATPTYTGGYRFIPNKSAEFNHLYVAYEGVSIHDEDIYALATMQVLLGGGGSFSAGGPGKGMYSRLYTHILNHHSQIDHCASFHHIYTDSSLFGLFASFVPASAGVRGGNTPGQILPLLAHQLSMLVYSPIPKMELQRAKNQLKSSLMMALESQAVEAEDLGRQILVHGRRVPISEMTEKIDDVKPEDIGRVATKLFGMQSGTTPTVVCMGHEDLGYYQETFRKYGLASN